MVAVRPSYLLVVRIQHNRWSLSVWQPTAHARPQFVILLGCLVDGPTPTQEAAVTAASKADDLPTGIPDPERPDLWLVCPWPARAGFCDVVRHFLMAYVYGLQGERSVARQLAYFEGYAAALEAAPTHDLRLRGSGVLS
jgi:hypothetical protein